MTNEYILVNIREERGHINGGRFWRLIFQSLDDGKTYEMAADPAFDNFTRCGWDQVVHSEFPYGVYTGLKIKNKPTKLGVPVLNADSQAHCVHPCQSDRELEALVRANQDSFRKPPNTFGDHFTNDIRP